MHNPQSTYRIQFNSNFSFRQGKDIIPYLKDIGITHIYASPIFKARRGSAHGYDVVDPYQINPELGGEEAFREIISQIRKFRLFWLQDIVPNHMAYDSQNLMLMDVFENGQDSKYFNFFDIDWNHAYENMRGRILAPLLGSFYAEALENGEIKLSYDEQGLAIVYYNLRFPFRVGSYNTFFEYNSDALKQKLSGEDSDFIKLLGMINLFKSLALKAGDIIQSEQMRHAKRMLWDLYNNNSAIKEFIDVNLDCFNGKQGDPSSFDALDKLISEQLFRLSFWKVAAEEINYRRFFTVNELISLRVEDINVLNETHRILFDYIKEGLIDGLRVDHIDGLRDPAFYLKTIRARKDSLYLVVEKILAIEEEIPVSWPIQGTTGYEYMNYLNGIFCRKEEEKEFTKIYRGFTGFKESFDELVCDKKRLIISKHLAGNVDNLAHMLKQISSYDRYGRDITLYGLRRALVEVMASFPVYRTYIDFTQALDSDKRYIKKAIETAKKRLPGFLYEFNFIEKFLLLEFCQSVSEEQKKVCIDFVMHFQQYTGPLMAKGLEDTMFYIYNRLISLNEVGGSPDRFGFSLSEYHDFVSRNKDLGLYSLNATSTHDTKRGEDVRARINVLSEIPQQWQERLLFWEKSNHFAKREINGIVSPDANDEYFIYQTLIGALPFSGIDDNFKERIKKYIIKSVREAKIHTAWIKPDEAYEEACVSFIYKILDCGNKEFLESFLSFQKEVAYYGVFNSLSQVLIKIASPGVADFYQGTELWDLNLVDPDNRGKVDYEKRMQFLCDIKKNEQQDVLGLIKELWADREDGRIKLFLIYRALNARKDNSDVFQRGSYIRLQVKGIFKDNVIAFARKYENKWAIIIAPRFLTSLIKEPCLPYGENIWSGTRIELPAELPFSWKDAITGLNVNINGDFPVSKALEGFPCACLINI